MLQHMLAMGMRPTRRRFSPSSFFNCKGKNGRTIVMGVLLILQIAWIEFMVVPEVANMHDTDSNHLLNIMEQNRVAISSLSDNNENSIRRKIAGEESSRSIEHRTNEKKNQIPIFYNLYVANATDIPRIQQLVSEQLSMRDPEIHTPVYVTTIGTYIDDSMLESFVYGSGYQPKKKDDIVRLGHHHEGNELLSLESLWEHCSKDEHIEEAVIYLHSKGSHTNTMENTQLRFFLTAGALSRDCADGLFTSDAVATENNQEDYRCNVCSTRFSPLPHPHTSGNMWAARCDYVSKLFQPSKFQQRMRRFHPPGSTPACVGRQRWAAEHWVHSHPTLEPCDLYSSQEFLFNYEHLPDLTSVADVRKVLYGEGNQNRGSRSMMKLQSAPRFDLEIFSSSGVCKDTGVGTLDMRLKEARVLYNFTADGTDAATAGGTGGKHPDWTYKIMPKTWWGWKFWNNGLTTVEGLATATN
eukprot:jgi/Psemu1/285692/fgenesh1_pg.99_\